MRLNVLKKNITLVRKGEKAAIQKPMGFQQVVRCACGEDMVLELNGAVYTGKCLVCKNITQKEKEAVPA